MKKKITSLAVAAILFGAVISPQTFAQNNPEKNNEFIDNQAEVIRVVGTNQARYIIQANDGATGLDLSFLENPRNVTLIPEQLLLDRKITTLEEALRNAPGVSAGDGFGGTRDDFFMRGFRRNAEYRNGFRRSSIFKANLSNVEYVQVVRGPAAITYGQVEPGGVVDVVTKKPLINQRIAGELRGGSYQDRFALIDYSQPINEDWAVRLVASTQDSESFRDFTDIKRDAIALSSRYFLSDSTQIDFSYEWREEARPLDRGTLAIETSDGPALINDVLDIPFSQRFGSPWEIGEVDFEMFELTIKQQINTDWNLEFNIAREESSGNDLQSRPLAAFVVDADAPIDESGYITSSSFDPSVILSGAIYDDPSDRVYLVRRLDGSRDRHIVADLASIKLRGEFELAGLQHQIVVGSDYIKNETDRRFVIGTQTDGITTPFYSFTNPAYVLPDTFSLDGIPLDVYGDRDIGVYVNLFTKITEQLSLLAGLRYSDTAYKSVSGDVVVEQTAASGTTPQFGLSYQALENISLFASYAESFAPNNVIPDNNGEIVEIDPQEGKQVEFGIKSEFFNGKVQTVLTFYSIEKTNVEDGLDDLGKPIFVDGRRSQGTEFTFTGQPLDGMNVSVSYAYTDAEDIDGLGNVSKAESIADNIFNLYTSYELQGGALEGLGVGAGYYYESDRVMDAERNLSEQVNLGDISLVDLSAWYTMQSPAMIGTDGTIRFQLAVKNLFDEEYYGAGFTVLRIPLGTPRTVTASVSFDF